MFWSAFLPSLAALAQGPDVIPRSELDVVRRDVAAGGKCGTQGSNANCASGLCCSQDGICGTGENFCSAPACQISSGPACDGNQTPKGASTASVPRPLFGSIPYGVDISHCSVNGKVAITFDDGPFLYTSALLDILKSNNARATFFVVGNNGAKGMINDAATGYPAILRRMIADGHQIGSHTWSHQDLSALTAAQRKDQIVKNEVALADVLGFFPTYLRPPYTKWNADALNDLKSYGYHVLNYDIDTRDWQGNYTYAENTYSSILSQHSPASSTWLSLEHDIYNTTVHVFAQYIIDQARRLKYDLVTVGECLADPPSNWYRNATTGQPFNAASFKEPSPSSTSAPPTSSSSSPSSSSSSASSSSSSSSSSASSSSTITGSASSTSSSSTTLSTHPSAIAANSGNNTAKPTNVTTTTVPKATASKSSAAQVVAGGGGLAAALAAFVFAAAL